MLTRLRLGLRDVNFARKSSTVLLRLGVKKRGCVRSYKGLGVLGTSSTELVSKRECVFMRFVCGRVSGTSLSAGAGALRESATQLLGRCGRSLTVERVAARYLCSLRFFVRTGKFTIGAVTQRVGILGGCVGLTVGGKLLCRSPFVKCAVGSRRARGRTLSRGRLGLFRRCISRHPTSGRILSTFLFDYCAKLECSSVYYFDGEGVRILGGGG